MKTLMTDAPKQPRHGKRKQRKVTVSIWAHKVGIGLPPVDLLALPKALSGQPLMSWMPIPECLKESWVNLASGVKLKLPVLALLSPAN